MLKSLKIMPRLMLGFGLSALLVVAVAASAVWNGNEVSDAVAISKIRVKVLVTAKDALLETRQARVQAWSYLATGDSTYLKLMDDAFTSALAKTAQEIARNVQDAAGSTQAVGETIAEVGAAASGTGQNAAHVLTAAQDLAKRSDSLRHLVGDFLRDVRMG